MPELPEVEALTRSLDTRLRGRRVDDVSVRSVAALKTHDPPVTALAGLAIAGCARRGKFIDLSLPPLHLVVHLARGGWITLRDRPARPRAATRPALRGPLALVVTLGDGATVQVTEHGTDKRLAVYVVHEPADVPGIARLGIDALDGGLSAPRLAALLAGQGGTLKSVLADQAVVAGIGNAYSDEILNASRLSPFRRAASLDAADAERLHSAVVEVLSAAVRRAEELDPTELKDDKRESMRVHGRAGLPCPACGDTVREVSLASRSFQYCPGCQTGGRIYADRRMSRLLK